MKVAVRYYTRSGNTKKLADQIAGTLGVKAESVTAGLKEEVDILFLGSSVYAAGVDEEVKKFIQNTNVKVGFVVNFSTAAIIKSTYSQIKKLLEAKGMKLHEKEYHCKGSFGIMHKGKPNASDLKAASEFAKSFVK